MPWLRVNQTSLTALNAVPTPDFALEFHFGDMPGLPKATLFSMNWYVLDYFYKNKEYCDKNED